MKRHIVLMYHDLFRSDKSESGFQNSTALKYKVSADVFEAQVHAIADYIKSAHLQSDYIDFTFDDGGVSFLTIAAPILERYGFKGKFYISTSFLGTKGFLNKEQVRELHQRGHYIGSHSHTHPERMDRLTGEDIKREWRLSQSILKDILGFAPNMASIPNGYASKLVLDSMLESGIEMIDTSATRTTIKHYVSAIVRGRYAITEDTTIINLMHLVSSPYYRFVKRVRYVFLEMLKAILGGMYLVIRKKILSIGGETRKHS